MGQRTPKKSESLEIRLSYPAKLAFMDRCRRDGRSASEAMRDFIDAYVDGRSPQTAPRLPNRSLRLVIAGAAAAIAAAAAVPSLARTDARAEFNRLDVDASGRLTAAEFTRLDADGDGAITYAEFSATR